ncbi:hypothetical protein B0T18DRAFT_8222 [Schizothecium vesticola]|uniref:Uncharacterized protein n=1 Tax=Schizothecium vesticola TaxID=314040 RepID=A0AA40KBJ8_9PEZI|nr:hypothetical protein B0T18DRAFT_8222 [Schizothecium vesticola]
MEYSTKVSKRRIASYSLPWAMTSAWLYIDTPTPVFNRPLNTHVPRPPCNNVSSLFLYDHIRRATNRSVNDTSNGGTDGTVYRPAILTSTLGTYLPTLILLVFLLGQGSSRRHSPTSSLTPDGPPSTTSVHIPKPGYSLPPFPHPTSPSASPDKAGKQGNRAYMQAFLPGRCKNSAESYGLAPTPPSFSKQTEYYVTHADTYTQYFPRRKGGRVFFFWFVAQPVYDGHHRLGLGRLRELYGHAGQTGKPASRGQLSLYPLPATAHHSYKLLCHLPGRTSPKGARQRRGE